MSGRDAPARVTDDTMQRENRELLASARQFSMRVLAASYQLGSYLTEAEAGEQDPDRLLRLYRVDHANTRIRRHAENLQVVTGLRIDDADRQVTSLLDVVRAAASAIEHYPRVQAGRVADLAVVEFAADDTIRILTELLDNATRFSPPSSAVTVSAHLLEGGQILMRVEDAGVGVDPARLPSLNAMMAGAAAPVVGEIPAAHVGGLVVVARLAIDQRLRVQLTPRQPGGMTATVLIPGHLLCEIPNPLTRPVEPVGRLRAVPALRPETVRATAAVATSGPTTIRFEPSGDGLAPRHRHSDVSGLPLRVPASLRERSGTPTPARPVPAVVVRRDWLDEAGDFEAGIADARTDHPTTIQGRA
jgi:hypothetical protein